MLKRSAGILVYKKVDSSIKVLLCHFGGPYWEGMDNGAWSIPKGELLLSESCINAARREFFEETGLKCDLDLNYLGSKKVSHRKIAIIFYVECDYDLSNCSSNTFSLEWPSGSGNVQKFPEMDKYEWMDIDEAREMIIENQKFFLDKLCERIEL